MKILIIEDEKIQADAIKEKLLNEGFDVFVANDGFEGVKLALSVKPDLILLDLLLPKLDGLSVLRRIRDDNWGLNANVIVLSNLSNPNEVTKGINIGLNDISQYMVKTDWSLDELVIEIKKRLEIN